MPTKASDWHSNWIHWMGKTGKKKGTSKNGKLWHFSSEKIDRTLEFEFRMEISNGEIPDYKLLEFERVTFPKSFVGRKDGRWRVTKETHKKRHKTPTDQSVKGYVWLPNVKHRPGPVVLFFGITWMIQWWRTCLCCYVADTLGKLCFFLLFFFFIPEFEWKDRIWHLFLKTVQNLLDQMLDHFETFLQGKNHPFGFSRSFGLQNVTIV